MRTIGFVIAAAVLVTLLLALDVMDTLELPARDLVMRTLPERPAQSTRVIAIDEASLRARGAWPWPRATLAEIIDRCARAGARAVVLDILLSEPRADDATLARAMRRMPTLTVSVLIEGEQWLIPSPTLRKSTRIAHGNFELDHDGILRRFASTKQNGTIAYTALSLEAASLIQSTAVPVGQSIAPAFRTSPRSIPAFRADDILSGRYSDDQLRGKI
ncbi:MAG TPA: CHASE2 domain-containing protein, partial [Thermoanaerobaculia bacterium]